MSNKAISGCLSIIIALVFMFGCQSNSSLTDNETQGRIARLEEKMVKLESAIQEKDTVIMNLTKQISTIENANESLSTELHQFKSLSENKSAINDIDIEKLMLNTWIALGLPSADNGYLYERYGNLSRYTVSRNPGEIARPILCNKMVNTNILKETTTYSQTK